MIRARNPHIYHRHRRNVNFPCAWRLKHDLQHHKQFGDQSRSSVERAQVHCGYQCATSGAHWILRLMLSHRLINEGSAISKSRNLACRHFLREDAEAEIDRHSLGVEYTVYANSCLTRKWLPLRMSRQKTLTENLKGYMWTLVHMFAIVLHSGPTYLQCQSLLMLHLDWTHSEWKN